jgi:hypothetical protein
MEDVGTTDQTNYADAFGQSALECGGDLAPLSISTTDNAGCTDVWKMTNDEEALTTITRTDHKAFDSPLL